jgi:hypothetical protein
MHDKHLFTNQRARIIKSQEIERFPTSLARFQCIAEALLVPHFREITSVLGLEGLSAETMDGLKQNPPWVGLSIQEPRVVMYLWPAETPYWMNFTASWGNEATWEETSPVNYRAIVDGRLAQRIGQTLDAALLLKEPPF